MENRRSTLVWHRVTMPGQQQIITHYLELARLLLYRRKRQSPRIRAVRRLERERWGRCREEAYAGAGCEEAHQEACNQLATNNLRRLATLP
jgi:hypothetical protein